MIMFLVNNGIEMPYICGLKDSAKIIYKKRRNEETMKTWKQTMKKVGALVLALALVVTMVSFPENVKATDFTGTEVLYLKPNAKWKEGNARFAICLCNGNSGVKWVDMTDLNGDGIYEVVVPSGNYKNVIFCRMNPDTTTNDWSNKWNQTADLTYDGKNNLFTINDDSWDNGKWTHKCVDANCKVCVPMTEDVVLSLKPNENWMQSNAEFAIYLYNGTSEPVWIDMKDLDGDKIYEAAVPNGNYRSMIFCRMNPGRTENNWNDGVKWNQTIDLFFDGTNNMYTFNDNSWDAPAGTWSNRQHECSDIDSDSYCDVCDKLLDEVGVHLAGYTLSLDGNIGVNFYMDLSEEVSSDETAKMVFTLANGTTQNVDVKGKTPTPLNGRNYYVFTCEVAAKEMADVIKAQIYVGNEPKGTEYSFTVEAYAKHILNNSESEYDDAAALIKAMLNYGAYSQTYFKYNTENLANKDLEPSEKDVTIADLSVFNKYIPIVSNNSSKTYYGSSLLLESEVVLRHYFTTNVSENKKGDYWYIDTASIPAHKLDEANEVTVGGVTISNYSPLSYAYKVLNGGSTDENLQNLMKAMYLYNQEANTYFGDIPQQ